jgi:hypothetical protein
MKDSLDNTGTASAPLHHHTWAATPGASTLGGATDTTLTITEVDENSNTAGTWIAIQCTSTTPYDAAWYGMWVNETTGAPLTPLDSNGWQAFETWDAEETVTGLQTATEYCFKAKAINAASVQTDLGPEVCLSTTGGFTAPPAITFMGIYIFGGVTDLPSSASTPYYFVDSAGNYFVDSESNYLVGAEGVAPTRFVDSAGNHFVDSAGDYLIGDY